MTVEAPDTQTDQLIAALRAARVFDLSQPFHSAMPQLPGAPRFHLSLLRRHGDTMRGEGYSSANEVVFTICHAGTHIDAIGHVSVDGRLHGGLPAEEAQVGTRGLNRLGIDEVDPILRRGVLLDIAGLLGVPALPPAFGVGAELLERALEAAGTAIEPGDAVLVRTGWGQFWDDPERYVSLEAGLPGVNLDGARWLAERRVFLTGADCLMYEYFHPSDNRLPVHSFLVQGAGIHLIENMNLEAIAAGGPSRFAFVTLPLRLVGATGSQVRPVALA